MKNKTAGGGDSSPEFAKGLMLKVVVLRVCVFAAAGGFARTVMG
jgi:hypothetical protein